MKYKKLCYLLTVLLLTGCGSSEKGMPYKRVADSLYAVMEADRVAYTRNVVNRLQNIEGVIKADEHWKENKALPLPAQMFRMGSERIAEKDVGFTYALLSAWPINQKNKPRTALEKQGLDYIKQNPGENFYGEEKLGDTNYYTAVYADIAVSRACTKCHNDHKDSPRSDFKLNDVMGGVVIRIPVGEIYP